MNMNKPLMKYRIWRDDVPDDAKSEADIVSSKTKFVFRNYEDAIIQMHELEAREYGVWFYIKIEFDD